MPTAPFSVLGDYQCNGSHTIGNSALLFVNIAVFFVVVGDILCQNVSL